MVVLTDEGASLPPATQYNQVKFLLRRGSGTDDDRLYVCFKTSPGTYAWALLMVSGADTLVNSLEIDADLNHDGTNVGFYGSAPASKQVVTGSRGGNAALASLLTALSTIGLITNSSSA
jgi:hypothetical protein